MTALPVIGRREYVNLELFGFKNIVAKIDSGAYTSSIHCSFIKIENTQVTCIFLDKDHPEYTGEKHSFELIKQLKVKSSNGVKETRCMIRSEITIFGITYPFDLTLTNRSEMKYPLLLGRKFLSNRFLVDVNKKYQSK